ncbi:MAG: A/G-specific adenine glycosylase [Nannocystaceae bacterium]
MTAKRGQRAATLPGRLAAALAPWFDAHHRDLPWRRTRDPYAIWVSEVMLQQTRVETVMRYYDPFVTRFPTASALARAPLDDVLGAWSGLGYYRRARLLHQGAGAVARDHDGRMPDDVEALRTIPGIGRYTAGAIASIAFDRPEALVDGNVARVLSRVGAIEDVAQQGATAAGHWTLCAAILREGSPRVLAQALMELGATVCTPRAPRCEQCPIAGDCLARARGREAEIPAVRRRAAQPRERYWAVAIVRDDAVLLQRRGPQGLLAGLWCLPLLAIVDDDEPEQPTAAALFALPVPVRDAVRVPEPVVHVFTHRIWELHLLRARVRGRLPALDPEAFAWVARGTTPQHFGRGGMPTVLRKLLARAWAP